MTESKPKPSTAAKPELEIKPAKPGLEVRPVADLEPGEAQSKDVRGGMAKPGKLFSDTALKTGVAPVSNALVKLHGLRF